MTQSTPLAQGGKPAARAAKARPAAAETLAHHRRQRLVIGPRPGDPSAAAGPRRQRDRHRPARQGRGRGRPSTPEGRAKAVEGVTERCAGVLQGAVANAGIDSSDAALTFQVNYHGVVDVLEGLRPALAAAGRASAVVTASHAALISPACARALRRALLAGTTGARRCTPARRPAGPMR